MLLFGAFCPSPTAADHSDELVCIRISSRPLGRLAKERKLFLRPISASQWPWPLSAAGCNREGEEIQPGMSLFQLICMHTNQVSFTGEAAAARSQDDLGRSSVVNFAQFYDNDNKSESRADDDKFQPNADIRAR